MNLTLEDLTDFTIKNYTNILQTLSKTYNIVPFCAIPAEGSYLILRHDIDFSLRAALKMAQIEKKLGIKSTYFVLMSSSLYSIFKENNARILKKISNLGHEIGLHYFPSEYRAYNRGVKVTFQSEVQMLEDLLGKKVYSIARHGPLDRDPFASIRSYINANHPFWRGDLFVHDSCRAWNSLEGLIKLIKDPPKRAQLLTHPENWQEDKIDRATLLERLFHDSKEQTFEIDNIKTIWLTDPLVLKYERAVKDQNLLQFYYRDYQSNLKPKDNLAMRLKYYRRLVRWYIVNSSIGWELNKMLKKALTYLHL